jgi:hypothetical protein
MIKHFEFYFFFKELFGKFELHVIFFFNVLICAFIFQNILRSERELHIWWLKFMHYWLETQGDHFVQLALHMPSSYWANTIWNWKPRAIQNNYVKRNWQFALVVSKKKIKNPRELDNYFLQIDFLFLDK